MGYSNEIDLSTAPSGALHVVAQNEYFGKNRVWHTWQGATGWEPWEKVGLFSVYAAQRLRWTSTGQLQMMRYDPAANDNTLLKWGPPWDLASWGGGLRAQELGLSSGPNPIQQVVLPDGRHQLYVVGNYANPRGADLRLLMAEEKTAGSWSWPAWKELGTPPRGLRRLVFVKRMLKDSVMAYCADADGYLLSWDGARWTDHKSVKTQVAGAYIVDRTHEETYLAMGKAGEASTTLLSKRSGPLPLGKPVPLGGWQILPEYLSGHYASDGRLYLFVALVGGGPAVIAEKSPGSAWTSEGWAAPIPLAKSDWKLDGLPLVALRVSWWGGGALACLAAFQDGSTTRLGLAMQQGPGSTTWSWGRLPELP